MPEYLFQIKGKNDAGGWVWPPLWTDKVEATDKAQARTLVEDAFAVKMPGRVMKKDIASQTLMLVIKEINPDDQFTKELFKVKSCKCCTRDFKVIEKYQLAPTGGGANFCSYDCSKEYNTVRSFVDLHNQSMNGKYPAVIYKITNKINKLCYIGKTTQAFTLRWYQHFFQGTDSKFHKAIRQYKVTDFMFEVIEIIDVPETISRIDELNDLIFNREMYWINFYDSLKNGYNSVPSKTSLIEELESQLTLFQEPAQNVFNISPSDLSLA